MRYFALGLILLFVFVGLGCADAPVFHEATTEGGKLAVQDHVAVLSLHGTPKEIGTQEAALVGKEAEPLLGFGPTLVKRRAGEAAWQAQVILSKGLLQNVAPRHRAELEAFQAKSGLAMNELVASQMLYDTVNAFGCSSLIVPAELSATGGPLLGRNFDYASFGLLHKSDLVKVVRPEGKFGFAAVSFPGCIGVISGMNEHGLALALHEVRKAADESPTFSNEGVPTLLALRQVLEECRTVDEAYALLKELPRTTMFNLALCDPQGGAVLEVTTKNVVMRRNKGINACTNHFRCDELSVTKSCDRYSSLMAKHSGKYTVDSVFAKLDDVNQREATFQSMVFEPRDLVLHVAIEERPSTQGTLRRIDLKPLFAADR
jgi:predicted choloylglycine hydrolase